ncbi:MAG: 16S rRNA (uracil(1498)-N(3))-methyltransferase [Synechococcales cyanobacterium]
MSDPAKWDPRLWLESTQVTHPHATLTPAQGHYLHRVLRLTVGDPVYCVVAGELWEGYWQGGEHVTLRICLQSTPKPSRRLHLGIGVPKQGMDDLLYQLTELGVTAITPLLTSRSVAKPEAGSQRWQRWLRIMQEAAEQSEHLTIPTLHPPQSFAAWIVGRRPLWIAEARHMAPPLLERLLTTPPITELTLATGPEGGWTEEELTLALQHGAELVSLGRGILRAVTAPVVAASLVSAWEAHDPQSDDRSSG